MALDGTITICKTDLLPKEDLYKRWGGATDEEIAGHFSRGELCAYAHYKGPINDVLWCRPGFVYYQSRMDYSNPDSYEYIDHDCDYFLLKDVERCEAENPEYIGNITPESLGLVQSDTPESVKQAHLHAGLSILSANEVINQLGITPINLLDLLNGYDIFDDDENYIGSKRLVTVNEESFREYQNGGLSEKYFNITSLKTVTIYQIDFDELCTQWKIQKQAKAEEVDTSDLEAQLAEAQAQIKSLQQWNKRLNELNKELRTKDQEKDTRITEPEKELAPNAEPSTTTRTQPAVAARQKNVLEKWKSAFKIMVKVILQCHADGEQKRTKVDISAMYLKHGDEITATQLGFLRECLRECLGEGHVNTEGGAPTQN